MLLWTTLKTAISSLLANKFRTLLAMLGIIIGVGAVISMLAIGAGARRQVMEEVGAYGANFLTVRPQYSEEDGAASENVVPTLTLEDGQAVAQEVADVDGVTPLTFSWSVVQFGGANTGASVVGVAPPFFSIRNFPIQNGRALTERDATAYVAVIGADIAEKLFPQSDPVGARVKINEKSFQVVGVLKRKGDAQWRGADALVILPVEVFMKKIFGVEALDELNVQVNRAENVNAVIARVITLLRRRHHLRPRQSNDFHIRSQEAVLEMQMAMQDTFRVLLASIAGISLLVGGIGIMNIMLVTVRERTKEIGIRKAIGARDRDVLRQFLLEALMMCFIGGLLGVAAGVGSSYLLDRYSTHRTVVELYSLVLSLGVASSVGVFFGYYPASRAAKLNTIDALRYE
ncbi:multidrug ABC transporter substrate-binding protein [Planctomycetales bacterium]|nr:multidrug ABC transporter substrate-binding protein [Planctomycetales bacterium]GHT00227.1 multidrug ABC transporter substrate-binding protein [Planctomycetales bacterium]